LKGQDKWRMARPQGAACLNALLLFLPFANAAVSRIFGSTADDVHAADPSDEEKITIYTAVMCVAGGMVVVYVIVRFALALQNRHKNRQTISPVGDSRLGGDVEAASHTETRFAEESKDIDSSFLTPSKPKRKMRIKLAKNGMYSMSVQSHGPGALNFD